LVGAAVGDALGAGYEAGHPLPSDGRAKMISGGIGIRDAGEWTDDTAQTFGIAVVAAKHRDLTSEIALDAIAAQFIDWFNGNPPDVGLQTSQILRESLDIAESTYPTGAQLTSISKSFFKDTGRAAGNGSLMRTAPVAIAHLDEPGQLVKAAMAVSALTHGDPIAGESCALWCLELREQILNGSSKGLGSHVEFLPESRREFWKARIDEAENSPAQVFTRNGFVPPALQAAWASAVGASDKGFSAILNAAIAIGDDTDTIAAIAGAWAGAHFGLSAMPQEWVDVVYGWPNNSTAHDLEDLARKILRFTFD
jgi:ADP-ribosylglycohydrolase